MAKPVFDIETTGDKALVAYFNKLGKVINTPQLRQALVDGSMVVEEKAKKNLQKMIYDLPETDYHRTRNLIQRTVASSSPQYPGKAVDVSGNEIKSGVASLVHYAVHVNFGTSKMTHRPYLTQALKEAEKSVMKIIGNALLKK